MELSVESEQEQGPIPRWMWWAVIVLLVLNTAVLAFLWWTPLPDLSVIQGHSPEHDLRPYVPSP